MTSRYALRLVVAVLLTCWTVVQGLTLPVMAVRGGDVTDGMGFFVTGVVTIVLGLATWRVWLWTLVARPREESPHDVADLPDGAPRQRHRSFSGEDEPPRRW